MKMTMVMLIIVFSFFEFIFETFLANWPTNRSFRLPNIFCKKADMRIPSPDLWLK